MTQEEKELFYSKKVKKALRNNKLINEVINIANDSGSPHVKLCAIRDVLLHDITGFWWDELSNE